MIGGYSYISLNKGIDNKLRKELHSKFKTINLGDNGYLFYDEPYERDQTSHYISSDLIILSQDLLVSMDAGGEYRALDLQKSFPTQLRQKGTEALAGISSDFRMIIFKKTGEEKTLYLISNRAGSGRMFYHKTASGILFSSDLRFLLKIIHFEVSKIGIYSILKYGAVPEPMTISSNISAVPASHYLKYQVNNNTTSMNTYFKFKFIDSFDQNSQNNYPLILKSSKTLLQKSARFLGKHQPIILVSGGIDSSLYAAYLAESIGERLQGFYCAFAENDPELKFAKQIAEKVKAKLHIGIMKKNEAINIIEDVVKLTDHPFDDFSSLPITYTLKFIKQHLDKIPFIIECNGADDCFGVQALDLQSKYLLKHCFPNVLKNLIAFLCKNSTSWKWESHAGILARILALADVHEIDPLNYFLVRPPLNFLHLKISPDWDKELTIIMEDIFSNCAEDYDNLSYKAKVNIKQLLHINSRMWAAKALSVGEGLGFKVLYPYIWREVLLKQGEIPWSMKIHDGIVKWPLKKLLEEFMPNEFIYREKSGFVPPFAKWLTDESFNHKMRDILLNPKGYVIEIVPRRIFEELLSDALKGEKLRFPVLNFLWASIFTEMWINEYKSAA